MEYKCACIFIDTALKAEKENNIIGCGKLTQGNYLT
jgi:hypothetical protein